MFAYKIMKKNISCWLPVFFFLNSHINMERKFIENDNTTREETHERHRLSTSSKGRKQKYVGGWRI